MSTNYVTLVAAGGTPVRLADQRGTPYPTTGSGSLVFADAPTIDGATLTAPLMSTITTASGVLTLPTGTDTLVGKATTDILTNKSISGATNTLTLIPVTALNGGLNADASHFWRGDGTWSTVGSTTIIVGTSVITSGTSGRVLYDNGGVVGEMTNTGTGTVVVLQTSPTLITPALGVATATSVAIGGATIGTNAFSITGTITQTLHTLVPTAVFGTPGSNPTMQLGGTAFQNLSLQRYSTSSTGSALTFAKSNNAVAGSQTIIANNDWLGEIFWNGSDGVQFVGGAYIAAAVDGTPGVNDMPTRLIFAVSPDGSATPAEALRLSNTKLATFSGAINYGGVTLTNAVTGTGSMVLDGAPTFSGATLTMASAQILSWSARSNLRSASNGFATFLNAASSAGVQFDFSTDAVLKIRNTANSADASLFAGATTLSGVVTHSSTTTLSAALTYGGVTLSNAVTGTGNMVLSAGATLTGTTALATATVSTSITGPGTLSNLVIRTQTFSVSGTYTPNANMVYCTIEAWGGGGGGGGVPNSGGGVGTIAADGGGAGGYSRTSSSRATIGASQVVTIGAAGTGAASGNNPGGVGGNTSVGALCIANGGSGGTGQNGAGGPGGTAGTGDITGTGAIGTPATVSANGSVALGNAGTGGSSLIGGGGHGAAITGGTGTAGTGKASGGGGGSSQNAAGAFGGGAGTAGYVLVTEFCTA